MKRILSYIALAAFSTLPFTNLTEPTVAAQTPKLVAHVQLAAKVTVLPAPSQQPVQQTQTQPPAFDPNNPATWPTCNTNQVVWASDGQCHDKPAAAAAPQPSSPSYSAPTPSYPTDHVTIMAEAGISPSDYTYVDYIVSHESGWNLYAQNPSGAYGLCQSLPAAKMATAGADWQTNPVTQMMWCNSYAQAAYGSWYNAYIHWINNQWW